MYVLLKLCRVNSEVDSAGEPSASQENTSLFSATTTLQRKEEEEKNVCAFYVRVQSVFLRRVACMRLCFFLCNCLFKSKISVRTSLGFSGGECIAREPQFLERSVCVS